MARRQLINSPWGVNDANDPLFLAVNLDGAPGPPPNDGYVVVAGGEAASSTTPNYLVVKGATNVVNYIWPVVEGIHQPEMFGRGNGAVFTMGEAKGYWWQTKNKCTLVFDCTWTNLNGATGAISMKPTGFIPPAPTAVGLTTGTMYNGYVHVPQTSASTDNIPVACKMEDDATHGVIATFYTINSGSDGTLSGNQISATGVATAGRAFGTITYFCDY